MGAINAAHQAKIDAALDMQVRVNGFRFMTRDAQLLEVQGRR